MCAGVGQVARTLVDERTLGAEYPEGVEAGGALEHVGERAADAGVEEPHLVVVLERVLGVGRARVEVAVEAHVVEVVVQLALAGEELLVVGLVHVRAHDADLLLRLVEHQPQRLHADHLAQCLAIRGHGNHLGHRAHLLVPLAQELAVDLQRRLMLQLGTTRRNCWCRLDLIWCRHA